MKRKGAVQNSWLYKHRYHAAGIALVLIAAFMYVYRFWDLPSGLSEAEMASAVSSANLANNHSLNSLVNLPWSIVQALSFHFLGISIMSMRLPAVIVTLLAVTLLIFLVRKLLRPSLGMMAGLLLASSSFTITMARSGVPATMTTLLIVCLLLAGYYAVNDDGRRQTMDFILMAILAGILCYMSAGLYILLLLVLGALIHPRSRLALRSSKKRLLATGVLFLITIAPLLLAGVANWLGKSDNSVMSQLFVIGSPSLTSLVQSMKYYAGLQADLAGGLVVSMITVVGTLMALIGLIYVLWQARPSIRCYALVLAILGIGLIVSCNSSLIYLLFVPTIILQILCLAFITSRWYGLFPNNPYARVFAILPIAILIGSLCMVDTNRYFNAVSYDSRVVYQYNQAIPAVAKLLSQHGQRPMVILASTQLEADLISAMADDYPNVTVELASSDAINRQLARLIGDDNSALAIINADPQAVPDGVRLTSVQTTWTSQHSLVLQLFTASRDDASLAT